MDKKEQIINHINNTRIKSNGLKAMLLGDVIELVKISSGIEIELEEINYKF